MDAFFNAHVLSIRQFERDDLERLFRVSDGASALGSRSLCGKVLLSAFFDNSTRTRLSHEAAMLRLGGAVTGFAEPSTTRAGGSSHESSEDVFSMARMYADVVVVRHPETGWVQHAVEATSGDGLVINGGDGRGEHPTQTMVDLYTMRSLGFDLDSVRVLLLNDLQMRCIRSLLAAFECFDHPEIVILAEDAAQLPEHNAGVNLRVVESLDEALGLVDVVYISPTVSAATPPPIAVPQNRPQLEAAKIAQLDPHGRIKVMHPLPRGAELPRALDATGNNAYWTQAKLGVQLRMALLSLMLSGDSGCRQ